MQFELINVDKVYQASEESKVYGAKDINLKISEGSFMALVGPSGSGKTTILNLIAGLRVAWALKQVGLEDMGHRFPKQLSGGQQQRVSIARAIAGRPQLILADEPTANLDSKTSQEIIELFKKLNQEFKLTFVFSTHDQRLIDQVKTVLYVKDGQIVESRNHNA